MKKIFFCIIIFFVAKDLKAEYNDGITNHSVHFNSVDTTTYPIATFAAINLAAYVNQPINNFLLFLDGSFPGYILGSVYPGGNLKAAGRINVYYGEGRGFIIHVNRFQYMDPYATQSDGTWNTNLFRQENISSIELWDNTVRVDN